MENETTIKQGAENETTIKQGAENETTKVEKKPSVKSLQDQMDILAEQNEVLMETVAILKDSVSKHKYEIAEKKLNDEPKKPRGFLKKLHGGLVVKWFGVNEVGSKAKQEILYNNGVPCGERLIGHYVFLDGSETTCDSLEFTRSNEQEWFSIVKDLDESAVVNFDDPELPREYKINKKYINP